jgi:hypothetical protein
MALLIIHVRKGYLNVMNFGCHADGETDDSAAMLAAMQAAVAQRRRLWIPAGTYLLSSALTPPDGLVMCGAGDTTHLKGWVKGAPHLGASYMKIGAVGDANGVGSFGMRDCHSMHLNHVTFVEGSTSGSLCGCVSFDGECYDVQFDYCTFDGNDDADRNGVCIVNYGQATGRVHDVGFNNCTWQNIGRIGAEIINRGDGVHEFVYPYYGMDFRYCTFDAIGGIGISIADGRSGDAGYVAGGDGIGESGNSVIDHCTFTDCGVVGAYKHAIEIAGVKHMTVTNNIIGGSHVGRMISQTNGDAVALPTGLFQTYNDISYNTFDGRNSAASCLYLSTSDYDFHHNTVICRDTGVATYIEQASDATIRNNTIELWDDAVGTLSSAAGTVMLENSDAITLDTNILKGSRQYGIVYYGTGWGGGAGVATNCVSQHNTYWKNSTDAAVFIREGSSVTRTDDTTYVDV